MHHRVMWHYHLKQHPFHPKKHPRDLDEEARKVILSSSIWKLFAKFALPSIFGMLMYAIYVFIDAVFVGQWVGKEALAAISIVQPLTLINMGIMAFMGMGSASLLSRAIGARDESTVSKILGNNILFIFIFSLIFMFLGYFFAAPLVHFMGGRGQILAFGTNYFRIVVLGSFFINFIGSTNMLIRAEGQIKAAMILITVGSILNICLDPIFIKILGMGIEGAAIATVISMFITSIVTLIYFFRGDSELSLRKKGFHLAPHLIKDIAPVGVSAIAMQLMTVIQQILIFKSVGFYGKGDDLALIGATLNMLSFALIPMWGISAGLQPIIGMNFGAKQYSRVKEAFNKFLLASTIIALVIWAIFMIFPSKILGLYITDPGLASSGVYMFRIVMSAFFLQGFILIPATLFQSIGKGKMASIVLLVREILLFAPVVIVLPIFMGLNGIWISIPVADAVIVVLASILFIRVFRAMVANKQGS